MSLHSHLIFNPQPTAIWLQPTLLYQNCSCQLCYDLLFVTCSGCISALIFTFSLNNLTLSPIPSLAPTLFAQNLWYFILSVFLPYFWLLLHSLLSGFPILFPSHVLVLLRLLHKILFSLYLKVGQRIIFIKIMGRNSSNM